MKKTIDCEYTHELICPYCGKAQSEPEEYFSNCGTSDITEIECGHCDLEFSVCRHVDVTYISQPMVQKVEEGEQ